MVPALGGLDRPAQENQVNWLESSQVIAQEEGLGTKSLWQ